MRSFKFTQTNSSPYSGLDGTVIFGDGTATYKIQLQSAEGLGVPQVTPQTQKAPFQQGSSLIRTLYEPRTIALECSLSIAGTGAAKVAEATTIKRALGRLLSPVGMGFMQDTSLSSSAYSTYLGQLAYASDGVTYDRFIDCVPMVCEMPNKFWDSGFYKIRVVFFCPDPTWYGAVQAGNMEPVTTGSLGAWNRISYSPELGLFCAVSSGSNNIQTSPDGITWTLRTGAVGAFQLSSIAWSSALRLFCAVGSGNGYATDKLQTSPDGITWTLRTGSTAYWSDITWSPELGLFCAIAYSTYSGSFIATNYIQTSPDGITWTLRTGATTAYWSGITWSPELGLFCAVASSTTSYPVTDTNYIQTSPDGITWTLRTGSTASWSGITWSPELGLFCAIAALKAGVATNYIQTSPDGITWTLRTGATTAYWSGITWSPELGLFCAVGSSASYQNIQTSPDGITWTLRTGANVSNRKSVQWSSERGMFCILPTGSDNADISYDGINWIQNTPGTDWYYVANNAGDIPTDFILTVPVLGGETGKVLAVGENFLWAGVGTPPGDHNIVVSTQGLKTGNVVITTKFGSKSIKQFNQSILTKLVGGAFFSLYVTGATTNTIYLRNTGTPHGTPSITWKNRYLSV